MQGYRTLAMNSAIAILGVVVAFNWAEVLPPQYAWAGLVIVSVGNIVLRFLTSTPVFQTPAAPPAA